MPIADMTALALYVRWILLAQPPFSPFLHQLHRPWRVTPAAVTLSGTALAYNTERLTRSIYSRT